MECTRREQSAVAPFGISAERFMQQPPNTSQRDAVAIRMGLREFGLASLDVLVFGTTIVLISVCIAFAVRMGTVLAFLTN